MLSVLLGLTMSVHLMAYQATQQSFDQQLVSHDFGRVVSIHWEWKNA